jgi:hypothetical protein
MNKTKKSSKREAPLVNSKVVQALRVRTDLRVGGDTPAPAPTAPIRPNDPPPKHMI